MIYDGLRVVDLSTGIAGGYCSKLLADLGADVVKLEPSEGDPLRRQSATGSVGKDGDPDGVLFRYLHTSQRSVVAEDKDRIRSWVESADIVLESFLPGAAEELGIVGVAPVTVSISSFGRGGPDSELSLPEEVLQARSGSLSNHGHVDKPPLTVGGQLGEYVTGAFAALGAVTAWWRASRTGNAEHVDVSMLEAMQYTLVTVPTIMARFPGGHMISFRWVMLPGNEPTGDGKFVGITTVTTQQWRSLLRVMGRDDLVGDEELMSMLGRFKRAAEVNEAIRSWTMQRTADEVVEKCAEGRVPAAVVGNGQLLPTFVQLAERRAFERQPASNFVRPRAPFRFSALRDRVMTPAPRLGEHDGDPIPGPRPVGGTPGAVGERPFTGVRVLDFTAFWSGPFATAWWSAMGADVVKVESVQRPDGIRFSAAVRPKVEPRYYEMAGLFHATNLGKRGITLDLGQPEGLALARRLLERSDIVCENFTPRVMDGFGLDYEAMRAIRPDVIVLRLPAFGLEGPWRDRPGFAQTMEQITGMAWLTGYEGGPPIIPGGFVDPAVGVHAAIALVAALEHRDRTGEGQLVEMPMIEVAAAMTAEQVAEYSAYGELLGRRGERGVYRCEGEGEQWVAVHLASDPLPTEERATWCAQRPPDQAAKELLDAGIPAAAMVPAFMALDDPQLRARRYFEPVTHPLVGEHEYPGWPMRFSGGPDRYWRDPAPLLGQHNDEVLRGELGVGDDELARLRQQHVIGDAPVAGG
ncbi:MAG TPA: CoA transferase [Acidimicrobiia bacterium]|nr:CoA transferase [Acidimicrobiia bacterium]